VARWLEWPAAERAAVSDYLDAFFESKVHCTVAGPHDSAIDTVLCSLGRAQPTIDRYLNDWLQQTADAPMRQLGQLIWINAD